MEDTINDVLSELYTDKISIKDACEILNKTREEVWTLLDSFEYFPTSEDVIIAYEIEQKSMKIIDEQVRYKEKFKNVQPKSLTDVNMATTFVINGSLMQYMAKKFGKLAKGKMFIKV